MFQIFCFTHAGGTIAFYDKFESYFLGQVEFVKLEYSGHGTRIKEPLYKSFDEACSDLYNIIKSKYKGGNYALIGYSMGTLLAFWMLKYINDKKELPLPKNVFHFAHSPKSIIDMSGFTNVNNDYVETNTEIQLSDKISNIIKDNISIDEYVKIRTLEFGAIPKSLLNNKTFWRTYLPIYKADYLMINNSNIENVNFKSTVPATIFYGNNDELSKDIKLWDIHFSNIDYYEFEGSHFFINEHMEEVVKILKSKLLCGI